MVADYTALHKAVADSVLAHKYYGAKLPTKKDKFDWTMGPGAAKLGELSAAITRCFSTPATISRPRAARRCR